MQTYTVQNGDTLYGISKQFGVSIENLRRENNLTSNTIVPGQVLKIPTNTTTILYTVKRGDNLYTIAKTYNTTVEEILRINNLKSPTLTIGQQLIIPIGNTKIDNSQTGYITYIIKKGDNLYNLASTYNTTVNAIMKLNNLTSTALSIGQQLKIPTTTTPTSSLVPSYKNYTVQKGDSLYKIARMFDMTVEELMELNNLSSSILSVGQVLRVKNTVATPPGEKKIDECYGEGYQEPIYQTYTVKNGDNLYTIAQRFNTTVEQLIALNDLTTNNLSIGQVLKIKEVTQ